MQKEAEAIMDKYGMPYDDKNSLWKTVGMMVAAIYLHKDPTEFLKEVIIMIGKYKINLNDAKQLFELLVKMSIKELKTQYGIY